MNELTYDINSGLIAAALLVSMVIAMEIGLRIGRAAKAPRNSAAIEHVNGIQASMLGILALLLAFTLSLSLQRFDSRSEAVVDEANAIGTAYLRSQLLPAPVQAEARAVLREYLDLRVQAGVTTLVDNAAEQALIAKTVHMQNALWANALRAAEADPRPVTAGLYIQSVNDLIDSFGRRDATISRHVPEVVLLLMYGTFLLVGSIVGFACGAAGHRPSFASYVMVVLIIALVSIVIDLDRPRRGLITVSQKSLLDLNASIRAGAGSAAREALPATGGKR
jgi:hypothetical protein